MENGKICPKWALRKKIEIFSDAAGGNDLILLYYHVYI